MGQYSLSYRTLCDGAHTAHAFTDKPVLVDQSIFSLLICADTEGLMPLGYPAPAVQIVDLWGDGIEERAETAVCKPPNSTDVYFLAAKGLWNPERVAVLKGKEAIGVIAGSGHGGDIESARQSVKLLGDTRFHTVESAVTCPSFQR